MKKSIIFATVFFSWNSLFFAQIYQATAVEDMLLSVFADMAANRLNDLEQEIAEKEILLMDNEDTPNFTECWIYTKDLLFNAVDIWETAELDLKQRFSGLITPAGFLFDGKIIQPIKNPHFISVLHAKNEGCKLMGG